MTNKIIELKDMQDNVLLPHAYSAKVDSENREISTTYATRSQLSTKQGLVTGAATTIVDANLVPQKALISDSSGKVAISNTSSTELSYLSGASSNIQTQINTLKNNIFPSDATQGDVMIIAEDGNSFEPGGSLYRPGLFTYQGAEHILNDIQWLRIDTFSWQNGDVYAAAYNHLVADLSNIEASATTSQVNFYGWEEGHGDTVIYTETNSPSGGDNYYDENGNILGTITSCDPPFLVADGTNYDRESSYDFTGSLTSYSTTQKTETIGSYTITYYEAADGHKIILPDQIETATNIYNEFGTAWYYVIDIDNKRFKLPRLDLQKINHGKLIKDYREGYKWYRLYADGWCEQGDIFYTDVNNWQNATGTLLIPYKDVTYHVSITSSWCGNGDGASYYYANNNKTTTAFMANITQLSGSYGYATWKASGYTNRVLETPDPINKYIYCYVGDFAQSALEQTAGITSETLNDKVDTDFSNLPYPNFDCVVSYQAPNAQNGYKWYRLYKSGWCEQGGCGCYDSISGNQMIINLPITMVNNRYTASIVVSLGSSDTACYYARMLTDSTTSQLRYYMFMNNSVTTNNPMVVWEVKGFAAI